MTGGAGLPPLIPPVPELRAGADAVDATRATRLAAALLSDVHTDLTPPALTGIELWAGRARGAADAHQSALAREVDVVVAALEVAVRGLEAFEHEVADLLVRRDRLAGEVTAYGVEVRAAASEPADPQRARGLRGWHDRLVDDVARLRLEEVEAEDALLRVLLSVDTDDEARGVAGGAGRPDPDGLARGLAAAGGRPDDVREWWRTLSAEEREALLISRPDLVVDADGVPGADRDDAGRVALGRDLPSATGRELEHLTSLAAALAASGSSLLLRYDRRGDGRGAVAYGDPDTADRTAVMVPGLGTDLTSIEDLGGRARDLRDAAVAEDPSGSVASVTWVGYDAPDFTVEKPSDLADPAGVLTDGRAFEGGGDLVGFVDGLRASDEGEPSRLTVVGHSYGSTTTAWAGQQGLDADAIVLVGSPGAGGAGHVDDLRPSGAEVYVGSRDRDPVTWLGGRVGGLGLDPAQEDFGAVRIDVGEGEMFHVEQLGPIGFGENHSSYFDPGSRSLENIAVVVDGGEPDTVAGRDRPARALVGDLFLEEGRRGLEWVGDRLRVWD